MRLFKVINYFALYIVAFYLYRFSISLVQVVYVEKRYVYNDKLKQIF